MTVTATGESESESGGGDYDYKSGMDFCKGMSMTMSMGGFQSALFSKDRPADCITFLFTEWKLDHPGKFVCAMSKSLGFGKADIERTNQRTDCFE